VEDVGKIRDNNQTWQTLPLIEAGSSPALLSLCAPGTMRKVFTKGLPMARRVSLQPKEEVHKGLKTMTKEETRSE
jgi:hypothetical protein